jgi:hypothetical protein
MLRKQNVLKKRLKLGSSSDRVLPERDSSMKNIDMNFSSRPVPTGNCIL